MNKFGKALEKIAREKKDSKKNTVFKSQRKARQDEISNTTSYLNMNQPKISVTSIKTIVDSNKVAPCITALHDPRSHISEQYRVLRTNLKSLRKKSIKTILVTSSLEGEGKTVTALNFAFTLAQDKTKKILLLDADMRRSKVGYYLGLKKKRFGFKDFLEGEVSIDDVMVSTEFENLHILPGNVGKNLHNASELLGSVEMKKIIAFARDEYDYVVIDAPPIIPVTDAAVLGTQVDGVIMVFQAEKTQRNTIRHAQNLLEQAQTNILGYVMTNVRYISPGYRDYYYWLRRSLFWREMVCYWR